MKKVWASVLLCVSCAPEQPTQALVVVDVAPELAGRITRLEMTRADALWQPSAEPLNYFLGGTGPDRLPLSFAATPDEEGHVRMLAKGYVDDRLLMERRVDEDPVRHEKQRVDVMLRCGNGEPCSKQALGTACDSDDACESSVCRDNYCCQQECEGACMACDVPGQLGQCAFRAPEPSPANCGGCDRPCNLTNVASPHCTPGPESENTPGAAAKCDGTCAEGWGDCGIDQRTEGCSIDLATNPYHCGDCATSCPFRACSSGTCVSSTSWNDRPATEEVRWTADRMFGVTMFVGDQTRVTGLGIKLRTDVEPASLKIGLYSTNEDGSVGRLVRETSELSTDRTRWKALGIVSDHGGIEVPIEPVTLTMNTRWWLFFIANRSIVLMSMPFEDFWRASAEGAVSYAGASELPMFPGGSNSDMGIGMHPLGAIYTINVPDTQN